MSTIFLQTSAPVIVAHDMSWYIDITDKTDNTTEKVIVI